MKLTFKYPVYPTTTQEQTLFEWLDHLCELQNSARHDRIVVRETENRFVTQYDQQALLTVARPKYDDFRGVPQDMQVSALKRNDKAFAAFRRRCENGAAKKGYPRYKKRVRSMTWSLRKYKGVRENPIIETDFRHNRLKVPKLGEVRLYMHRPLQATAVIAVSLLIETTTLHLTFFSGLLRPFVESGGLPPSMKRETTRIKRLALRMPSSYRCLM